MADKPKPSEPFHNPFKALRDDLGDLPDAPAALPPAKPQGPPSPRRAVVRMERKGRGGKQVTVIEQLGLSPRELEKWLKAMKQALGCGGVIERDSLVLQGDCRARARALLLERGVAKVTVG